MKIFLTLIISFILVFNQFELPKCNTQTAVLALKPRIFQQTTIDGIGQNTLLTRYFHNKVGILGSEFGKCYFNFFDPVIISKNTLYFGLFPWLFLFFKLLTLKKWKILIPVLLAPILPFFNFPFPVVYFHKIFAIIGLLTMFKIRLSPKYLPYLIIIIAIFLRFFKLADVPVSLYWDEVSLGYNAYSILKTGHDEHNNFLPLTNFAAFGDYKPPLYIYSIVPSIALFGLNEFAVRFPSAFFGALTVLITYLLTRKLTQNKNVSLLAAFFLAISPWHLQFSRGAFEANLGLFFSTLGIYLFVSIQKYKWLLLPSLISFAAAMYTFTGQRLFAPLIIVMLFIQFRKLLINNLKVTLISLSIFAIIFWPLFNFATQTIEGKLRFEEVTIFRDLDPVNESVKYRQKDNYAWWSNIIHNRRLFYFREYLIHYFDAFNPSFLFSRGDVNPRLSVQEVGELFYIDLPLLLAGIYFLIFYRQKYRFLIIGWLLISPLGPATARETPHALRMIHILPTFQIIAAYGAFNLYKVISYKKTFISIITLSILVNFLFYAHIYYKHWPVNYSGAWQYGYKQLVHEIKPLYDKSDRIIVSNYLGRAYINFLFHMPIEPKYYWETKNSYKDNFAFYHVDGFGKFRFVDSLDSVDIRGRTIVAMPPGSTPSGFKVIKNITDPLGKIIFEISEPAN